MRQQELLSHYLKLRASFENLETNLGGEIVEKPHVVIAGEPAYFHSTVGEFGEFSEEPDVSTRHHILVLIPIVENIAKQINLGSIVLDGIEEIHQAHLMLTLVGDVTCTKVCVGYEINFFHDGSISQGQTRAPTLPRRSSFSRPTLAHKPG